MLAERKRFNYLVNTNIHSSQRKPSNSSALKSSTAEIRDSQLFHVPRQQKENCRGERVRVEELEQINKKLVEETAKQFKKLEEDVQRVEQILEDKEIVLDSARKDNAKLSEQIDQIGEEKKILIEAIFQKDIVIREYEAKLKELMEEKSQSVTQQQEQPKVILEDWGSQTEPLPESCPKIELTSALSHNFQLEDEVFRLKEELFDAHNKVKLLTQQFEAYKILKEIETLQEK